jgi:hypothetical protein
MPVRVPLPLPLSNPVSARDLGKCQRCGRAGCDPHHRKPRARGGPDWWENLIYLCRACHSWAHHDPDAEFDGYLIPSCTPNDEIADVPVFYFDRGAKVLLDGKGGVNRLEAA